MVAPLRLRMRTDTSVQMISAAASAFFGLCSGLIYDILRPLRKVSRAAAAVCDMLFCMICTLAMFIIGMAFCGGRPGFWECALFVGAFAAYLWGISPTVAPIFCKIAEKISNFIKKLKK